MTQTGRTEMGQSLLSGFYQVKHISAPCSNIPSFVGVTIESFLKYLVYDKMEENCYKNNNDENNAKA